MSSFRLGMDVAAFEARLARRSLRAWILGGLALVVAFAVTAYYCVIHRLFSGYSGPYAFVSADLCVLMSGVTLGLLLGLPAVFYAFDWVHRDEVTSFEPTLVASPLPPLVRAWGRFLGLAESLAWPFGILVIAQVTAVLIARLDVPLAVFLRADLRLGLVFALVPLAISFGVAGATRSRAAAVVAGLAYWGGLLSAGFLLPERWVVEMGGLREIPIHSHLVGYLDDGIADAQFLARLLLIACFVSLGACGVHYLPRHAAARGRTWAAALALGLLSALALLFVDATYKRGLARRADVIASEAKVAREPEATVTRRDIDLTLEPRRSRLSATATLHVENRTEGPLKTLHFELNPGLAISAVTVAGAPVAPTRDLAVVTVSLPAPLLPAAGADLAFTYAGGLDPAAVDPEVQRAIAELEPQVRGNRRFLGSESVILAPGAVAICADGGWYPEAGVRHGHPGAELPAQSFAAGRLVVHLPAGWRAGSVGARSEGTDGSETFTTDVPVPGLALVAGPYVEKDADVAGIRMRLLYVPRDSRNVEFFAPCADALLASLKDEVGVVRSRTGLAYPYPELTLAEVPSQFAAYESGWLQSNRMGAPGLVMLRETGVFGARFEHALAGARSSFDDKSGGGSISVSIGTGEGPAQVAGPGTPKAKPAADLTRFDPDRAKVEILRKFVSTDWLGGDVESLAFRSWFAHRLQGRGGASEILSAALPAYLAECAFGRAPIDTPDTVRILNKPAFQAIIFKLATGHAADVPELIVSALADMDRVYDTLRTTPLSRLDPAAMGPDMLGVVFVAGRQPLAALHDLMGEERFAAAISALASARAGGAYTWDDLRTAFADHADGSNRDEIAKFVDDWSSSTKLPSFHVLDARLTRAPGQDESWQARVTVLNDGDAAGNARLSLGTGNDAKSRLFQVPAGGTVEVGMVLPAKTVSWQVTPYLALNRRALSGVLTVEQGTSKDPPFDGVRPAPAPSRPWPVVVDNMDDGFRAVLADGSSVAFSARDDKGKARIDEGFPFRPLARWQRYRTRGIWYTPYGDQDATAAMRLVTAKDAGHPLATWEAHLPSAGVWRVEAYLPPRTEPPQGPSGRLAKSVTYVVSHGGKDEKIPVTVEGKSPHWADLGKFDLGPDVKVALEAEGDGMIMADAVRFTQEQP